MLFKLLTIDEVNNLISEHFIKIFGNIVEHTPAAAIGILKNRPFVSAKDISNAVNKYLDTLKLSDKEKILQAHHDIVKKLIDSGLSLILDNDANRLNIEDKKRLNQLNNEYKKKFNFPFVMHGKANNIKTIFNKMQIRIKNDKEHEILLAIEEVKKMTYMKIFEIVL